MVRRVLYAAPLVALLLGFPWGIQAASQDAAWELRLVATVSGRRGSVLMLEGSVVVSGGTSQAWGGGTFVFRDRAMGISTGSWAVLSAFQWPDPRIPAGRRLQVLISLPLPNQPAAVAELEVRAQPQRRTGRVTVTLLGNPDFQSSGFGTVYSVRSGY
jgi:hypothetical protein